MPPRPSTVENIRSLSRPAQITEVLPDCFLGIHVASTA